MENQLQTFDNRQVILIQDVHCFLDEQGTAHINITDAARGLGFTESKNGVEYIRWRTINGYLRNFGFSQEVAKGDFIPENIFYLLAMKANNETAKKFQWKVANEILPRVRKHGVFMTTEAAEKILSNPDFIIKLAQQVKDAKVKIAELENQVAILEPKADYCNNVLLSDEHLTSELIAKEYGHTASWLNQTLVNFNVIYKRGRVYYLKSPFDKQGYRISETVILDGGKTVVHYYWTQKGRNFIYNFLKSKGILPLRERPDFMDNLFLQP